MSVAAPASDVILERLLSLHPKRIDLVLDRIQRLLAALGHPEKKLPPVIHVAGTNGKGSTCAFCRAMLEAQGLKVHVYSSPHLVRFHERIRLAGKLISEEELSATLLECEEVNLGRAITHFEITTAAAILAFSRHVADALILEVGLGGTYDATNVIAQPRATVITPVSFDHEEFLGSSLGGIAAEKAGIIKAGVPVVVGLQDEQPLDVIARRADALGSPILVYGQDFFAHQELDRMVYQDADGLLDLPLPKLRGQHQVHNAATAIAALRYAGSFPLDNAAIEQGVQTADWPARFHRLGTGRLISATLDGDEVWLDGGHNPAGSAVLANLLAELEVRSPKPVYLIWGMLNTKDARAYIRHLQGVVAFVAAITIPDEREAQDGEYLAQIARSAGFESEAMESLEDALAGGRRYGAARTGDQPRIVIAGSLSLAGKVLKRNGNVVD